MEEDSVRRLRGSLLEDFVEVVWKTSLMSSRRLPRILAHYILEDFREDFREDFPETWEKTPSKDFVEVVWKSSSPEVFQI
ncbi:hypothetical protein IGI04_025625 [Brassica rapa subsp. trilocularis]|uniref:Uncharacterized protein n=1 Tax=Brassica rapa subsp. trilocularis TaxID=1813537 RepID=A0ABQ7KTL3_BRACM|nr:hypothetical protein IGI04_025625 [Brassica rapa subsp. trilocularis]